MLFKDAEKTIIDLLQGAKRITFNYEKSFAATIEVKCSVYFVKKDYNCESIHGVTWQEVIEKLRAHIKEWVYLPEESPEEDVK